MNYCHNDLKRMLIFADILTFVTNTLGHSLHIWWRQGEGSEILYIPSLKYNYGTFLMFKLGFEPRTHCTSSYAHLMKCSLYAIQHAVLSTINYTGIVTVVISTPATSKLSLPSTTRLEIKTLFVK